MNRTNLALSEMRKLTTTRMPLAFVGVLSVLAVTNGVAVAVGTDMDGSKTFVSSGADQQSLMAFAANAMMITGLFGAIASAREYADNTVIAKYLSAPRRRRALGAQLVAIALGGAVLGLIGVTLTVAGIAATLPLTDHGFMVSTGGVAQVVAASAWAGAAGAVLGAGVGNIVRNTGGAVTGTVLALVIAPPVVVQLANDAANWLPSTLATVISGVTDETTAGAGVVVMALWALVPVLIALGVIQRRDVV